MDSATLESTHTDGPPFVAPTGYLKEAHLKPTAPKALQTFSCIVADPPWEVKRIEPTARWGREAETKVGSVALEYPTMSKYEIAAMPVRRLAARDAHLYLWTINAYVEDAYWIARAWGFTPSTLLTWGKPRQGIGLGGTYALTTEHVLFCRRGSLKAKRRVDTSWWDWKRGAHSAKPEAFIDMVESVSPGPYLELFARRNRLGWSTWGNQCFAHVQMDNGAVAPAPLSDNEKVSERET